jgi:ubiquitin-conjugating enzyme E2 J2
MWSVSTILTGLYSFMIETAPTLGSIDTTKTQKQKFARQSLDYNVRDANFTKLFPQYVELHRERVAARQAALGTSASEMASSTVLSHDPSTHQLRANEAPDMNGLFATAAGVIAVLSIIFAMRFL